MVKWCIIIYNYSYKKGQIYEQSYEGDYINNKREGYGVYIYSDGSKYNGHWKNDIRDGKGVYIDSDGNIYDGMFKNDLV